MRTTKHSSYRHIQEKLKVRLWLYIVLARFLSFLTLILTYYRERF